VILATEAVDNYVALAVSLAMVVLLVLVLVFPERF
jgi:hypothetical protein